MQERIELERRLWWLLVLALLVLLCLWGIADTPLLSTNEGRRAVTVREMFLAHDWLLPRMNGELYLAKPPLFYWLALLPVYLAGGVSEWAVRLPSVLFALATLGATYACGKRLGGRAMGLFAAMFLAANAGFSLFARSAEIEMSLTGLCFLALLCAWVYLFVDGRRRWSLASYALLGGALLSKGPVALLLVTLPVLVLTLWQRPARGRQYLTDLPGWALAIALGAGWYALVTAREGMDIWKAIFQQDIVEKVSGGGADPWYAYLLYLAGDFFPFWLLLFYRPAQLWRQVRQEPRLALLACAALAPLLVFSLFSDKHAKYLLPSYPAVALLLAWHWTRVLESLGGWKRRLLTWAPVLLVAGFAAFYGLLLDKVFGYRFHTLPQITRISAEHPQLPLYSLGQPDMRLVYYAGRRVEAVNLDKAAQLSGGLLFVEGALPERLKIDPRCVAGQVPQYLSKRKVLQAVLLGSACPPAA
ncbi:ArnT family glycosyltransferase [Pseudomonas citronellolis]|uniref:ArnT family glycosyltransferase n=1 Tax=Pseudomonas citronellolis TaxID=53408 RepID=UPI0023E36AD6|nr:glycosyltransferase family 39 protein [Pseudomonas citronellolis]MDF3936405.1 glycosyltransferase family 39 protein [Pseudomonas citronellolis]